MTKQNLIPILAAAVIALGATAAAPPVFADAAHGSAMGHGKPGKAASAKRTIKVTMRDNEYEPSSITVKSGETVRFIVTNKGELVHEFNIGTAAMHAAHQKEMMMMVEHGVLEADKINLAAAKKMQATMGHGMHNDLNSVLLEPGKKGTVVWTFPKDVKLEFGCNVPGHYEAGMVGNFTVTK